MATESATTTRTGPEDETELPLPANVLALLGYLFNVVGAILLLVLEDNEYVRHHAAQSLLFTGAVIVARVAVSLISPVIGFIPLVGDPIAFLLNLGLWAVTGLGFLFLMYKGFTGERYALPVLGEYIDDVTDAF